MQRKYLQFVLLIFATLWNVFSKLELLFCVWENETFKIVFSISNFICNFFITTHVHGKAKINGPSKSEVKKIITPLLLVVQANIFSQIAGWQANLKNNTNKKQLKTRDGARAFLRLKM